MDFIDFGLIHSNKYKDSKTLATIQLWYIQFIQTSDTPPKCALNQFKPVQQTNWTTGTKNLLS